MTDPSLAGRSRSRRRGAAWALAATVVLLSASGITLLAGPARAAAFPATWVHEPGPGFGSWSDGTVTVAFPAADPSLRIVSVDDSRVAASVRLSGLAEITPTGHFGAYASFASSNTTWSIVNRSVPGAEELVFSTVAPVVQAQGVWESGDDGGEDVTLVGNATLEVDVYLNTSAPASAARIAVAVGTWPWNNTSDALGLDMGLVAGPSTRIAEQPGPGPYLLREVVNGTNVSVASLSWASGATVHYTNGTSNSTGVRPYTAVAPSGGNSTVRLLFTNVPGGYDTFSYDPWIALYLGAFHRGPLPSWMLSAIDWGAVGAGAAVTVGLAWAAMRRRPPTADDEL